MASAGTITFTLDADNSKMLAALRQATGQTEQFAKKTESGIDRAAKKIKQLVGAYAGMRIVKAVFVDTTQAFAEFEAGLDRAAAVANVNKGDTAYAVLRNDALELAKVSQYTATEVTSAYNFMAMAGMKTNDIMAATPAVLQLASAGAIELGAAADIVTNVMAGYGMQAQDLARVNDIMVASITGANVDVRQLGTAFKYAGPVAKAAGMSFEESAAAISLLGNAGIQGSMAGTTLRGAMSALLNPSKKAQAILDALGVSVKDSTGKLKPMSELLRDLAPLSGHAGAAMELFGLRAGPGMLALLEQGAPAFDKFVERLEDSEGMADKLAKRTMETLKGQFNAMKASANALAITFGEALAPTVTGLAKGLGSLADTLTEALNLFADASKWAGAVAELGLVEGTKFFEEKKLEEETAKLRAQMQLEPVIKDSVEKGLSEVDTKKLSKRLAVAMGEDMSGVEFDFKLKGGFEGGFDFRLDSFQDFVQGAKEFNFGMESEAQRLERLAKASEMNAQLLQAVEEERIRLISEANSGLLKTVEATTSAGTGLGSLANVINAGGEAGLAGAMSQLGIEVLARSKAFESLGEAVESVFQAMADLLDVIKPLIDVVANVVKAFSDAISGIKDGLGGLLSKSSSMDRVRAEVTQMLHQEAEARAQLTKTLLQELYTPEMRAAAKKGAEQILAGEASLSDFSEPAQELIKDYLQGQLDWYEGLASIMEIDPKLLPEFRGTDILGSIAQISGALDEGADTLGSTVDGMQEVLNAPAGLKLALHRFNAINGAQVGGMTQNQVASNLGSSTGVGRTINLMGDVIVNGVTDVDGLTKEIQHQTTIKETASEGATSYAETATGAGVGRRMP